MDKKQTKPKIKNKLFFVSNNKKISPSHEKNKPVTINFLCRTVFFEKYKSKSSIGINSGFATKCKSGICVAIPNTSVTAIIQKIMAKGICILCFIKAAANTNDYFISI